ncbi:Epoxide hydrolase [Penicillium angulare]|uniref:Epoxide hydrolase n=1 Tax=Penicillium angulare TaxID=116970 RepID=UPI002540AC91|nr:Epoxide hydrolase [Penicillium angulare]KAJ5290917.1 Epoxide hydrolase [Penicillium angulare]
MSYQSQSGRIERVFQAESEIRSFLVAIYTGQDEDGDVAWDAFTGLSIDRVSGLKPSQLLSDEELSYYTDIFARRGLAAPLIYYRTREINYRDEIHGLEHPNISVPVLFIQTLQDQALHPHLLRRE